MPSSPAPPPIATKPKIWWTNAIFFISFHLLAINGILQWSPWSQLPWQTRVLWFASWQLASFGITLGYHRLWSHRAYEAALPIRIVLAIMGCLGFQGSIRWWVLRHRLHHRFTDDPVHDPYAASKGLLWSHCGWIFLKPKYERLKSIERDDLDADPVVCFQHKHYVAGALLFGLAAPAGIGSLWGDALGGFVWGGLVARLFIWHTTFCINSLAHWTGLQPYTDEISARGNYFLALLTSGEGNHNYHHAFPNDYKNGPHPQDWDPTKWIIWTLHSFFPSLVPSIKITPQADILRAQAAMLRSQADELDAQADGSPSSSLHSHHRHHTPSAQPAQSVAQKPANFQERERAREKTLPNWTWEDIRRHAGGMFELGGEERRWFIVIDGWVIDVGGYLTDHPGGPALLKKYAISPLDDRGSSSSYQYSRSLSASSSSSSSSSNNGSSTSLSTMSSTPTSPRLSDCSPSLSSDERDYPDLSPSSLASSRPKHVVRGGRPALDSGGRITERKSVSAINHRPVDRAGHEDSSRSWRKDASSAFNGGVNRHTKRARNEMLSRRVAKLQEDPSSH